MNGWDSLTAELDRWAEANTAASFWWRDDDAETMTPALLRILELHRGADAPLALAIVPIDADDALAAALTDDDVDVLQHGYAHINHEAEGRPKCELGAARAPSEVTKELALGRRRLAELFGARALPVLVPPWNRMSPSVLDRVPGLGFCGVSMFKARTSAETAPGLTSANTHVDIIDWRGGRGFCGEEAALQAAVRHLSARRSGGADADEPTGLLTHHLMHDGACTAFIERFAKAVNDHAGARWVRARAIFGV